MTSRRKSRRKTSSSSISTRGGGRRSDDGTRAIADECGGFRPKRDSLLVALSIASRLQKVIPDSCPGPIVSAPRHRGSPPLRLLALFAAAHAAAASPTLLRSRTWRHSLPLSLRQAIWSILTIRFAPLLLSPTRNIILPALASLQIYDLTHVPRRAMPSSSALRSLRRVIPLRAIIISSRNYLTLSTITSLLRSAPQLMAFEYSLSSDDTDSSFFNDIGTLPLLLAQYCPLLRLISLFGYSLTPTAIETLFNGKLSNLQFLRISNTRLPSPNTILTTVYALANTPFIKLSKQTTMAIDIPFHVRTLLPSFKELCITFCSNVNPSTLGTILANSITTLASLQISIGLTESNGFTYSCILNELWQFCPRLVELNLERIYSYPKSSSILKSGILPDEHNFPAYIHILRRFSSCKTCRSNFPKWQFLQSNVVNEISNWYENQNREPESTISVLDGPTEIDVPYYDENNGNDYDYNNYNGSTANSSTEHNNLHDATQRGAQSLSKLTLIDLKLHFNNNNSEYDPSILLPLDSNSCGLKPCLECHFTFPNLRFLNLNGCAIDPSYFRFLPGLTTLYIDKTRLTIDLHSQSGDPNQIKQVVQTAIRVGFTSLSKLEALDVSFSDFLSLQGHVLEAASEAFYELFSQGYFVSLKWLMIRFTSITEENATCIAEECPNLKELHLQGCRNIPVRHRRTFLSDWHAERT